MNYVKKIKELSEQVLEDSDIKRVCYWLDSRDLMSVKEIVSSELLKFASKKPISLDDRPMYDEKFAIFVELSSTVAEYLRFNDYSEDELNITYDEEY